MGTPRITVINDNPDFLELMGAILDDESGYEVRLLDGDETGLEQLQETSPDLIIVDLLLGRASGWELIALARADATLREVPIIVCSADVNQLRERAEELADIGDVHMLKKPFAVDELTSLVDDLIGQPASR